MPLITKKATKTNLPLRKMFLPKLMALVAILACMPAFSQAAR